MTVKKFLIYIFMTISASQYSLAGNIFSGSLSNFKGVGEIPLPSGEWEMKSFEKISDAGNFTDLDYDSNNFYDDNLTFYLSKIDTGAMIKAGIIVMGSQTYSALKLAVQLSTCQSL